MLKVLTCLQTAHDPKLVLLAVGVCLLATGIGFWLNAKAMEADPGLRRLWLGACAVAAGSGVWASHFIGVLAFEPGMRTGYEVTLTLASWLTAMVGAAACFGIAATWRGQAGRLVGGAALGLVVAAMHYIGMAAFRLQGYVLWDKAYVIASVLVGVGFSAAAMLAAGEGRSRWRLAPAAALLALGVCGLHFTAMTAVVIVPDSFIPAPETLLSSTHMAGAVTGMVALLALSAMVAIAVEARAQVGALEDLRQAIGAMADAVAFFDPNNRYVIWNAPYAELARRADVPLKAGLDFEVFLRAMLRHSPIPEAAGCEEAWIKARLARRAAAAGSSEHQFSDRWLRVQERRTARGGYISVIADITDLKRQRDEAEAANRAKSEFLANMSHEIRTPLNGVIGVAQMLAKTPMTARQREMVAMVDSSAMTLQAVLADILDLARIEAGRLEISDERFHLGELVRDVAGLWRLQAEQKGLDFGIGVAPDADGEIEGDPIRLRQILTNLCSNAMKFTAQGSISLRVFRPADAPGDLVIEVGDTGIGFGPELAQRLFQRFEQADGSSTRRFGGSGLGLAICRELTERMGGSITAESEPGKGATFRLRLPAPALAPLPVANSPAPAAAAVFEQPVKALRVLVAEDHPVNRKVLQMMLEITEAEAYFVENGAEAVDAFGRLPFDLILMDMQMPVMDGLAAVRAIRERERLASAAPIPIAMLTAHAMPEHVNAGRDAGADHHLAKPISTAALFALLAEVSAAVPTSKAA